MVKAARGMSTDSSAYVRCIANETMARYGSSADRHIAVQQLLKMSDVRANNLFISMSALNSLDWCQPTASEVGDSLKGIADKAPGLSARYGSYVPNLIKRIQSIAH